MIDLSPRFSAEAAELRPSPIRRLAAVINDPSYVSFAGGVPNPETFPTAALAEIVARLLRDRPQEVLQYSPTWGPKPLREFIARRMEDFGVSRGIDGILVTSGSQQALDLVARVLLDPGDVLFVELPSYVGALAAFRARSAKLMGIPARGDGGWDLPALAERIRAARREGLKVKGIYAIPNFQNPAGTSIPAEQRPAIAAFLAENDLLCIEDDPYGELNYTGVSTTPLASCDREDRVVYLGTFSKVLAPALRTAWIAGSPPLVARCELAKQAADLCSSSLDQQTVAEFCAAGLLPAQIEKVREIYRGRRRTMLETLDRELPADCSFTRADGGLFSWVTLPAGVRGLDSDRLLEAALAEERIAFVPGTGFFVEGEEGKRTLRLTFAKETDERMKDGLARLASLIRRTLEAGRRPSGSMPVPPIA